MAFIIGMILLVLMMIFRKEFRHQEQGYVADHVRQPAFTFVMAGLITVFCCKTHTHTHTHRVDLLLCSVVFSLIAVVVFGAKVFTNPLTVNWAYILAILAMCLFLAAAVLFVLDGLHSERQSAYVLECVSRLLTRNTIVCGH
jgi:hypothetical protein